MNVNTLYDFMKFVARKNQSGGIRVSDFHTSYNAAQKAHQSDLMKMPQTADVIEKLSPFRSYDVPLTFALGVAAKPSGLIKLESMRYNGKEVEVLPSSQIASGINSVIDPPDANGTVYAADAGRQYNIYPTSITTGVRVDFMISPPDIVWNHTTDGDGRFQYTSAGSVDPIWDDNSAMEIAGRALKALGVSFEDSMLFTYGQQFKQSGS